MAAHQAEEESEETAEHFLEGKTDIDDFLASFMEKRTVRCRLHGRESVSVCVCVSACVCVRLRVCAYLCETVGLCFTTL